MTSIYRDKKELIESNVGKTDVVLDVGFWGQGVPVDDPHWPHRFLLSCSREVYGIDFDFDPAKIENDASHYRKGSAEEFNFNAAFDVIFAGDLIEHLSNPGRFLSSCLHHLKPSGRLILTTPNCFNLFNMAEKLTKREPTVNSDHTCYFNEKTLRQLLRKNGFTVLQVSFVYTLHGTHPESWKKKALNALYWLLSKFTDKYVETLVVTAQRM